MPLPKPDAVRIEHFPTRDGELCLGGMPLSRLCARVGRTPFYAYDRQQILKRIQDLRAVLPNGIGIRFAIKANPMPAVVDLVAGKVDGLDVASGGELKTALDSGMPAECISFAGPGKRDEELQMAIAAGVRLNVESADELERVMTIQQQRGWKARVALRINPDFELKGAGMRMGGGAKPFGIDAERLPQVLDRIRNSALEWDGLHIFTGSQLLRTDALIQAHAATLALITQLEKSLPGPLPQLNLGAGFGIPYFPGERALELTPVADSLRNMQTRLQTTHPGIRIELELGRYLVGEAGIYVCRILERKVSRGKTFLITDGGLHQHLAASGNFGQVLRKNYPLAIGNRMPADTQQEIVTVTGPLCTPLDVLGENVQLPIARPGDLVVVFQSGAYGYSASPLNFLGHPHPAEVLV